MNLAVHVPWDAGNPYQRLLELGLELHGWKVSKPKFSYRLSDLIGAESPSIIHFHWSHHWACRPIGEVASHMPRFFRDLSRFRRAGGRVVWTVHNLRNHENRNPARDYIFSYLLARHSDAMIVHGRAAARRVARYFAVSSGKLSIIPHMNYVGYYPGGMSRLEACQRYGLDPGRAVLLFFGTIRRYKRVCSLIRSFGRAGRGDWQLLIVGNPAPPRLAEEVGRLARCTPDVRLLTGFLPEEDVQHVFAASDLMVLPYRDSLTSGACVLALSQGTPVLCPDIESLGELAGDAGILYPQGDSGLETAIRELPDISVVRGMAKGAVPRVAAADWRWVGARTAEVYERARLS